MKHKKNVDSKETKDYLNEYDTSVIMKRRPYFSVSGKTEMIAQRYRTKELQHLAKALGWHDLSGCYKDGKRLGKGGSKCYRKIPRDSIQETTRPAI